MNTARARVRSMKARRTTTCRCGRLIQVGHRIVQPEPGKPFVCIECALAAATGKPAPETRNAS